jgi:mannose-1-phosphate guanylyltransferase/MurNAc alpha-1-phosphate uridylyltransferase
VTESVVGAGAVVAGAVRRCVVWPGARVGAEERLVEVIRAGRDLTVRA